jgi:hypothetical protein
MVKATGRLAQAKTYLQLALSSNLLPEERALFQQALAS